MKFSILLVCLLSMIIYSSNYAMKDAFDKVEECDLYEYCQYNRLLWLNNNKNDHIGFIDKLMLARSIKENGFSVIEQVIKKHEFIRDFVYHSLPKECNKKTHPFCIKYTCMKNDNSELSKAVFEAIHKREKLLFVFVINNPVNLCPNAIDECTSYKHINSETVTCKTYFYDKEALLAALQTLRK